VLTHGDWPFNLMAGADGAVRLVDWDELMLAPAERDTWFAGGDQPFWRAYHAGRPGHRECEPATAFYLYGRYFEDLVGSMRVILGDLHVGNAALRARSAAGLDGTWIADLRAWLIGRQRRRPS
jgi:hypothetical protein